MATNWVPAKATSTRPPVAASKDRRSLKAVPGPGHTGDKSGVIQVIAGQRAAPGSGRLP